MDQELRQRLIGAAIITALAAIFMPMLFDDAVDETGKSINELKIPELPAKTQEVEIMPLPEKAEDVATVIPVEKAPKPNFAAVDEGEPQAITTPKSIPQPVAEMPVAAKAQQRVLREEADVAHVDPDGGVAEEAEFRPQTSKPVPVQSIPAPTTAVKPIKPLATQTAPAVSAPVAAAPLNKPLAVDTTANLKAPVAAEATNRWYLNAGSFSQKANAAALQESLKQQGFAATIKEAAGEKGLVYKVRIGPMLDKAKAQAVKNKLTQINVNTFVSPEE